MMKNALVRLLVFLSAVFVITPVSADTIANFTFDVTLTNDFDTGQGAFTLNLTTGAIYNASLGIFAPSPPISFAEFFATPDAGFGFGGSGPDGVGGELDVMLTFSLTGPLTDSELSIPNTFAIAPGSGSARVYDSSTGRLFGANVTGGSLMSVPSTPLPAALPLFASGLGALGLLGWRRKRKAAALAA
ncbi:MAG: PEP-CTERM sorting domain-containing protein [Terracidiphilus sp.]